MTNSPARAEWHVRAGEFPISKEFLIFNFEIRAFDIIWKLKIENWKLIFFR